MEYTLIETDSQLPELIQAMEAADLVGMDTEFVAEDCYKPDLCLIQVSTREHVYMVDPKAVEDISEVWRLLVDPSKTVVVHAGREEILFAYRATGKPMAGLFDVQLALGMLGGEYPASYGKLLQRILGEAVPKGETRTDWRKRPLTKAQLKYAALDVYYLPDLYDELTRQLDERDRQGWIDDETNRRQSALLEIEEQESWHRMSGLQSLNPQQLAIVRRLWQWRDSRARSKNMPARRVLRDDLIVELAKRGWTDASKIANIRGLHHGGLQRFLPEIADCVADGLEADPPKVPWGNRNKRSRPPALLQQFMTAALAYLCRTHSIAPQIVGTSDDVGKLVSYWSHRSTLPEEHEDYPALLKGWRSELVAEPLFDIFSGRRALRVQDPRDDMPLSLCEVKPEE